MQNLDIGNYIFYQQLMDLPFVEEIWLFGSRARGDHDPRSDIDLAIYAPRASDLEWSKILDIIDGADTLLKIDCIRLDRLKDLSAIKDAILTQGIKLYERLQN